MPQKPNRPFVPHRTPAARQVPPRTREFRLARPFVHGEATGHAGAATKTTEPEFLAPIADFLAMESPAPIADFLAAESPASIADFMAAESPFVTEAQDTENEYELPPIEHFTDTISGEDTLGLEGNGEAMTDAFEPSASETESGSYGWEETDWQRYDWRSAAALGDTGDPAASSAWAETDWGSPASAAKDVRDSAARAIADALDGIARRIRDGDLVIPQPPVVPPDPATIAATLAAILGVRR